MRDKILSCLNKVQFVKRFYLKYLLGALYSRYPGSDTNMERGWEGVLSFKEGVALPAKMGAMVGWARASGATDLPGPCGPIEFLIKTI